MPLFHKRKITTNLQENEMAYVFIQFLFYYLMICSSDGFTNILTLRIYEIECCSQHSTHKSQ